MASEKAASKLSKLPADRRGGSPSGDAGGGRHSLTRTLLLLTVAAGLVDAISFLGLGQVFTANQTGNIVLLGFGIAGSGDFSIVSPLLSIGGFLLGAALGGMLATWLGDRRARHISFAVTVEVAAIGGAAIMATATDLQPNELSGNAAVVALALAMGVQGATARQIGVRDLTATVVTMTMAGLAAESTEERGKHAASRATAIVAMLAGAIVGALLLRVEVALALAAAAAVVAAALLLHAARAGPVAPG